MYIYVLYCTLNYDISLIFFKIYYITIYFYLYIYIYIYILAFILTGSWSHSRSDVGHVRLDFMLNLSI